MQLDTRHTPDFTTSGAMPSRPALGLLVTVAVSLVFWGIVTLIVIHFV